MIPNNKFFSVVFVPILFGACAHADSGRVSEQTGIDALLWSIRTLHQMPAIAEYCAKQHIPPNNNLNDVTNEYSKVFATLYSDIESDYNATIGKIYSYSDLKRKYATITMVEAYQNISSLCANPITLEALIAMDFPAEKPVLIYRMAKQDGIYTKLAQYFSSLSTDERQSMASDLKEQLKQELQSAKDFVVAEQRKKDTESNKPRYQSTKPQGARRSDGILELDDDDDRPERTKAEKEAERRAFEQDLESSLDIIK